MDFFATCARGLEELLRDELIGLGIAEARAGSSGVRFSGDLKQAYRAMLYSRLASRVLLTLSEFEAVNAEALYEGARDIPFEMHLRPETTFAIHGQGGNRDLTHTQFIAMKVKDALVDRLRAERGLRPNVDTEHPHLSFEALIRGDKAVISLDLSGSPLNQRGYRRQAGDAPLRETLAAALLLRAGWPAIAAEGGLFVDPFCGSGTLLIEAIWMAGDVAPLLLRERFGFEHWTHHDAAAWNELRDEAQERARVGLKNLKARAFGFDRDPQAVASAQHNVRHAGLGGFIQVSKQDVAHLPRLQGDRGLILSNPPYGERLSDHESLMPIYRRFGDKARAYLRPAAEAEQGHWRAALITSDPALAKATELRYDKRYAFLNGAIECALYTFELTDTAQAAFVPKPVQLSDAAEGFRNRLRKNLKHLAPRLKREQVSCYRLYDADLPDYAAAVDIYEGAAHIQEYEAPKTIEPQTAQRRLKELTIIVSEELKIPREQIAVKTRRSRTRESQYEKQDDSQRFMIAHEGGLKFRVNLFDYLDTGLFLDHRPLRARVRELASGKRFLNLFCYTATVSVFAAAGGARATTSVDLSRTYLEWASENFALNGFEGREHRLVQADVLRWLAAETARYDLIYVDPPTFSNSKRAEDFDVQRDHVALIEACANVLAPGGMILFSNNNRRFKLDQDALRAFRIQDVTAKSIPFDFARDAKIHHCYEISRP